MNENLKKFIELVSKDPELAKKLTTNNKDEVAEKVKLAISIAKEKGIELTEKDFEVMTDSDLKSAAGGYVPPEMQSMDSQRLGGFFFIPVFFAANANILANVNLATNINVDANANVNFNANVHTNANVNDK